ncbi:MAG: polyphosphate kinase 2 [Dinoroseobacter sp.]|nr:polyphosphate kinase 2 [Dinoroseobacter sp.]MDJ0993913.1 polyphosphate kinase 2 [Dinoroseobacter sp.]
MSLPFDGAISQFYNEKAPKEIREAIDAADKHDILDPKYPYRDRMDHDRYVERLHKLQIELVKLQAWVKESGARIAVIFEGRDASGKGGTIKRFRENLNPRVARVVALPKPTDREAKEWYFQRYVRQLPIEGEITLFDRSWYNRAVVEEVFDFCTEVERAAFFRQLPNFETMLVDEGITVVKFWLNVGRAEQLRRFLHREKDPLKQWKLSWIDVEGLNRWDRYTDAIRETFLRTDLNTSPWTIVRTDDKRRARVGAIQHFLSAVDYKGKSEDAIGEPDPKIVGRVDLWHA